MSEGKAVKLMRFSDASFFCGRCQHEHAHSNEDGFYYTHRDYRLGNIQWGFVEVEA